MGALEAGPRFRILGALTVVDAAGVPVPLGGPRPRELLAMLLLHPGRPVAAARLVTALWGEDAGDGAATTLRTHVATVRRVLAAAGADGTLTTSAGGYALALDQEALDAELFERLVHSGQEALALGDPERAATLLGRALDLWRGEPLADLGPPEFATAAVARLEELRAVAEETAATAALALGRHQEVTGRLRGLVAEHPFRERFSALLVLALYRSGRQAEALEVCATTRRRLADELGLDPGPELQELERAVLRQDPSLGAPRAVAPAAAPVQDPGDAVLDALRRTPLVGREAELGRALQVWRDACAGGRELLLVSGPPGAGKSRLVAEVAHAASRDGATVLVGRCEEGAPYTASGSAVASSRRAQELLASAPPEAGQGPTALPWLLAALAAERPVLVVVEDAERIDGGDSSLLRTAVTRLPARALLVLCYRDPPGSRHGPLADVLVHPRAATAQRLSPTPLGPTDLAALVRAVHPGVTRVPERLVAGLQEQTGGNPFFASELLRDLDPADVVAGHLGPRLPAGVRDVLRHRLRGLPESTRESLSVAAVLGREVELDRLGALLDRSEEEVVEALEAALAAGFVVESGSSWAGGYAFPHELVREAVHDEVPAPRRRRLHLRVAGALLEGAPTDADVIAAAGHVTAAGPAADPDEAAELLGRAARLAAAGFGYEEAVRLAEARLPLLARTRPAREQADAEVEVARLRMRSGRGYGRTVELLEQALATYLSLGDTEAAGRVQSWLGGALSVPHQGMDVTRSLEHFDAAERLLAHPDDAPHLHRGRMGAAMLALDTGVLGASAERCAALARGSGRTDLAAAAGWGRGWHALDLGHPEEALARLEETWAAVRDLGDPAPGWPVANAAALVCTVYLGDPSQGRSWCRRALGQPRLEALEHPHHALVDQLVLALAETGELDAAARAAEALPADAVGRRLVRFLQGEREEAAADWQAALERDLATGDRHDAVLNARWLGEALHALGDDRRAVQVLGDALEVAVAAPQLPSELWLRARLACLSADGAADHLARCEELVRQADWRGLAGEVQLARAAAALRSGDSSAAERAATEAVATFTAYRLPWRRAEALRLRAGLNGTSTGDVHG
ncbi:AfsR/SARP family transcriptional regulator [Nocardioides caldifontis]|uniref:AfsR/SARP family transcriptional regulator n=1 Tax=Nocardioides caldifontis TaxID=2588938 RepID=UPI0011DFF574|nr:AfsR/SARP family transcriptional regulator [Nocardioides caldifontis]